jgi:ribosome maturation factor RimP
VLQLVLDHPQGVTLAHCEAVSKQASAMLDVEDFGGDRYVLEVTSPGLDRQLYRPSDYDRFLGRRARVTFSDHEGKKMTIVGRLAAFRGGEVAAVTLVEDVSSREHIIPLAAIKIARLVVDM